MDPFMRGKIMLVVNLRRGEDTIIYPEIAQDLIDGKYDGVALKVCHGNVFNLDHKPEDVDAFFKLLEGKMDFYGWHWNTGRDPDGEAAIAAQAIDRWGLKAYMMDYESPMKLRPDSQVPVLQEFRKLKPNYPLGLASYRYPEYHSGILWKEILPYFDFHAPQLYWIEAHNPVEQLEKSYSQLIALKKMPFYPIGCAYTSPDYLPWEPSPEELKSFDQACQDKGFQAAQYFCWRGAKPLGLLPVLAELDWGIEEETDPPVVDCQEAIDTAVEKVRAEYEARIKQMEDAHIVELIETARKANNEALINLIRPHLKQ